MNDVTSRLDAIHERVNRHGIPGGIAVTSSDVAYLLDLAQAQQAALDAVQELHTPRPFDPVTDGVYFGQTNMDYEICHHDAELYPCTTITKLEAKS